MFREKAASGRNSMMPVKAVWVGMAVSLSEDKYRGGRCVWILVHTWLFFCGLDQIYKNMCDSLLKSVLLWFLEEVCFPEQDRAQHILIASVFLQIKSGEPWRVTMFVSIITSLSLAFLEWQCICEKNIVLTAAKRLFIEIVFQPCSWNNSR